MKRSLAGLAAWLVLAASLPAQPAAKLAQPWRGVHFWVDRDSTARELAATLPALAALGVNAVVLEVDYSYEFQSHPELRERRFVTAATAHALALVARSNRVCLIPEFNCLGHQSFAHKASPLLVAHPDFNETPGLTPTNAGVYCLSWCPRAPGLNEIVFSLIDELADGFETGFVHVGMDEVYFIGETNCPRCAGADPAALFAAQVNALHDHIVNKTHRRMLMWADRLVGPRYQGISKYDNAHNDLSKALDATPKDIVMCDWHYEGRKEYPSVPFLAAKGYQVWPAGFLPLKAAKALSDYSLAHRGDVIGYLATTWNETKITNSPAWPPIKEIIPQWRDATR